jgi:hypothetical protein
MEHQKLLIRLRRIRHGEVAFGGGSNAFKKERRHSRALSLQSFRWEPPHWLKKRLPTTPPEWETTQKAPSWLARRSQELGFLQRCPLNIPTRGMGEVFSHHQQGPPHAHGRSIGGRTSWQLTCLVGELQCGA